jgi:hypothetical protein
MAEELSGRDVVIGGHLKLLHLLPGKNRHRLSQLNGAGKQER